MNLPNVKARDFYLRVSPYGQATSKIKAKDAFEEDDKFVQDYLNLMNMAINSKDSKIISMSPDFLSLIAHTKPTDEEIKPVYNNLFINETIEVDGVIIHGLGSTIVNGKIRVFGCGVLKEDSDLYDEVFVYVDVNNPNYNKFEDREYLKFAKVLVKTYRNLFDFMANYEKDYCLRDWNLSDTDIKKRESRGKRAVPKKYSTLLILSDRLMKYNRHFTNKFKGSSSISLVRGHWRQYNSDRYINKKGTKQWILPFIRGCEGILNREVLIK